MINTTTPTVKNNIVAICNPEFLDNDSRNHISSIISNPITKYTIEKPNNTLRDLFKSSVEALPFFI